MFHVKQGSLLPPLVVEFAYLGSDYGLDGGQIDRGQAHFQCPQGSISLPLMSVFSSFSLRRGFSNVRKADNLQVTLSQVLGIARGLLGMCLLVLFGYSGIQLGVWLW